MSFCEVWHHRLKYMLTPQLDLYQNISKRVSRKWEYRPDKKLTVLDYGCGNGFGTIQLAMPGQRTVIGMDSDLTVISFAKQVLGHLADFCAGNFQGEFPLTKANKNRFDVIVCVEVLEHCEMSGEILKAFRHMLKDEGLFVCSTLNHNSQYRKNNDHIAKYTISDFSALVSYHFPGCVVFDYTLENRLDEWSSITPMVAVWEFP